MKSESAKLKTFPLRMEESLNRAVEEALKSSILKSKHSYILQAVVEKIERDGAVQN